MTETTDFESPRPFRARLSDLTDWDVTWTMAAGNKRRTFTLRVPATGEEGAKDAAYHLAYAVNEGCGHVWKITDEMEVKQAAELHIIPWNTAEPAPTADAYRAACEALEKHRQRADELAAEVERLRAVADAGRRLVAAWSFNTADPDVDMGAEVERFERALVDAVRALNSEPIEQRTDLPVPETIIAQHSIVEPDPANEVTVRVAAKALGVTALISPEDSAICSYEVARRPLSATYQIAAALPAVNTVNQPGGLR